MSQRFVPTPVKGLLVISGWHGVTGGLVWVIGSTTKRFRIRAAQRVRMAGRCRYLEAGAEALVPKTAVRVADWSDDLLAGNGKP